MKKLFVITMALLTFSVTSAYPVSIKYIGRDNVVPPVTKNSISNQLLTVIYNPAVKGFEVRAKSAKKTFLKNVVPNGVIKTVEQKKVVSTAFGNGAALLVTTTDGNLFSFALYPQQPFLFISQTIKNAGNSDVDIPKLIPVSFSVDLGKPANQLKTIGTGGLLAPDKNPGSYVFLTTVDPESRNGVVAGWITNEKGSGVLFSNIENNLVKIKAQIDYGHFLLPAGKSEAVETMIVGYFDDARLGEEQFADAVAKEQNIKLKARSAVYCTWYSEKNGGAGSEASNIELAKFIEEKNLKSFGLGVIQIDDEWQAGGKFNGPRRGFDRVDPKGGYPNGMSGSAKALKAAGLGNGIWWMPFARNYQDPEYKDRQHWFAKHTNGKPFDTNWGGTSLDLTQPEVQTHIADLAKTMKNWGYDYFKMDGLFTGTVTKLVYINDGYKNDSIGNSKPLFNPLKTQIEAYRDGLRIIRKAVGEDVFFSGCSASQNMRSFGASIGLVNSMRIGPDFNHDGQTIRTGVIRASRLYFMNGKIWWNDPDPSMLREKGLSTADPGAGGIGSLTRARLLPSFVAITSQFFLSSDWLPDLPEERLDIMKRCMASHEGIARPVDLFDKFLPSIWRASDKKTGTERNVIGLFNWETTTHKISTTLDWAGLNSKKTYYAFDFWANKPMENISGAISEELPAESCKMIAVRARTNHPVVVSTSQHVTQGMIDLLKEDWKAGVLTGTSKIIGGDTYELRIAGLNDGAAWKVDKAKLIGDAKNVTIDILPQTEKGWLRVVIKARENQVINWQISFKK
ncbi:alpha-galactosidase [Pedobacter nyackensis]|uniref:glycoside hydrolase family 36 protein n=1 Tax=Pedobacter nyackensis TaxID=475255 RepID=UPI00292D805C|nr:alpha-galactosidase [Pedobacter nyackensis]